MLLTIKLPQHYILELLVLKLFELPHLKGLSTVLFLLTFSGEPNTNQQHKIKIKSIHLYDEIGLRLDQLQLIDSLIRLQNPNVTFCTDVLFIINDVRQQHIGNTPSVREQAASY